MTVVATKTQSKDGYLYMSIAEERDSIQNSTENAEKSLSETASDKGNQKESGSEFFASILSKHVELSVGEVELFADIKTPEPAAPEKSENASNADEADTDVVDALKSLKSLPAAPLVSHKLSLASQPAEKKLNSVLLPSTVKSGVTEKKDMRLPTAMAKKTTAPQDGDLATPTLEMAAQKEKSAPKADAETDKTIQGYEDGVFWERNSKPKKK